MSTEKILGVLMADEVQAIAARFARLYTDEKTETALTAATPIPYSERPRCSLCFRTAQHDFDCHWRPGAKTRGCAFCGRMFGITLDPFRLCEDCKAEGRVARDPITGETR